jgi:2,4-dienoyl-CoA reductase-like NADH-dependent reductase (Old Yellow Enzyme family)
LAEDPPPRALDEAGIEGVIEAFMAATRRALRAGFQIVEIRSAHGYLLHEFLSPLSNHRTDRYGGILENRMRLLLEVAQGMRRVIPGDMPLFVRISATDWVEGGWDLDQSISLAKALKPIGVDLIDVSSGALVPVARIPVGRNFQVPFAAAIRERAGIATGAVGFITDPEQADELITSGACDLVFLAREMLREPYWALKAQQTLGQEPDWPLPYGYAVRRPRREIPRMAAQKLEGTRPGRRGRQQPRVESQGRRIPGVRLGDDQSIQPSVPAVPACGARPRCLRLG